MATVFSFKALVCWVLMLRVAVSSDVGCFTNTPEVTLDYVAAQGPEAGAKAFSFAEGGPAGFFFLAGC